MSQLGHNHQHVYQNWERLLSCSKLYGVSISTNVFEVYMLQVKVNRGNIKWLITIPTALSISDE